MIEFGALVIDSRQEGERETSGHAQDMRHATRIMQDSYPNIAAWNTVESYGDVECTAYTSRFVNVYTPDGASLGMREIVDEVYFYIWEKE